jgi:glycine/D-amino acid oxidase-like deaminating enzyme
MTEAPGAPDVAVIGGGIVGCSLAALLAEAGARVRLFERDGVAAAASGRNSGVLQHPMDEALVGLHEATLGLYATLGHGFALPTEAAGLLMLDPDAARLEAVRAGLGRRFGELAPELLEGAALQAAAPGLAGDLAACRLRTGHPVPPAAATFAFAARARAAGAVIEEGREAVPWRRDGAVAGVATAGGERVAAGAVVVAAGPWTPEALDDGGAWRPVAPSWGVTVELRLGAAPGPVLEEAGVEGLALGAEAPAAAFSLATTGGVSTLGSTFLGDPPDPDALAPALLERGARFLPALRDARPLAARACPRPVSRDGRPLLGPLDDRGRLFVAAGHGLWGISLGPGSARLVADAVQGAGEAIPPELDARRFGVPGGG